MVNRQQRRDSDFDVKKYITGSNNIEGIYSDEEDAQSLLAWAYLEKLDTLSHKDIMRVQKMITLHQTDLQPNQRGYYRGMAGNITNVSVGGRSAPDQSLVPDLMNNWLMDVPKMTPLVGHIRFELIHPFVDGNGRTGRMVYWFVCKKRGIKPHYYHAKEQKNREHYYRLFEQQRVMQLSNKGWIFDDADTIAGNDEE